MASRAYFKAMSASLSAHTHFTVRTASVGRLKCASSNPRRGLQKSSSASSPSKDPTSPSGALHKKTLAPERTDKLDVQSENVQTGMEAKEQGTGGDAVTEADENKSTERAKKDFPEAPSVVIGMQDERGGKGY